MAMTKMREERGREKREREEGKESKNKIKKASHKTALVIVFPHCFLLSLVGCCELWLRMGRKNGQG